MKGLWTTRLGVALVFVIAAGAGITGMQAFSGSGHAASTTQTPTSRTITAQGHGVVAVKPDRAVITLGVQMQAKKAKQAFANSNSRMTSVVNAVKRQGVAASQIQTTSISLWFDTQRNVSTVSHSVTIRLDRVDKLGAALDAAVTAGANNSWGVSFGVKDPSTAQASALQAAIADAKRHATSIAKALGLNIMQANSVDETTYGYSAVAPAKGMGGGGGAIQPGESEVSADVVVSYSAG